MVTLHFLKGDKNECSLQWCDMEIVAVHKRSFHNVGDFMT